MKINVDDWHFRESEAETILLDAYLDNGQHAMIEVNPMRSARVVNGEIPEIIVFCELPGEKLSEDNCPARWAARPPDRTCIWSSVQMPMALLQQLKDRLGVLQPH